MRSVLTSRRSAARRRISVLAEERQSRERKTVEERRADLTCLDWSLPNTLYLGGTWNFTDQYAADTVNGSIIFQYDAKNVYFVASADKDRPVYGHAWTEPRSAKVAVRMSSDSVVTVKDEQLYTLVEGKDYGDHTLELDSQGRASGRIRSRLGKRKIRREKHGKETDKSNICRWLLLVHAAPVPADEGVIEAVAGYAGGKKRIRAMKKYQLAPQDTSNRCR